MFLSIIIPAYNEANRLPKSLRAIAAYLAQQSYDAEILVVENGSSDSTAALVQELCAEIPNLRLLQNHERGKGWAVRAGMLAAQGQYRFMCDADLSMPIVELAKFLPPQLIDYDVAFGSREAPDAKRYNEPKLTHLRGRVFSWIVKLFALPGFEDTQCGFKCFRAEIAQDLFSVQTLRGMSFDVELLYIARQRGYKIIEVPVNWFFDPDSKVRMVADSMRMFSDIFTIRRNWKQKRYAKTPEALTTAHSTSGM